MGIAKTLLALGGVFAVVAVLVDPGAFAVLIAAACFVAGIAMSLLARTRVNDDD